MHLFLLMNLSFFPESFHPLLQELQTYPSDWDLIQSFMEEGTLIKKYLLLKGKVQSGKSLSIIILNLLFMMLGYTPVLILRNCKSDVLQFTENFNSFRKGILAKKIDFPFRLDSIGKKRKPFTFYTCLSNPSQLRGINTLTRFTLTIDEVDFHSDKSETSLLLSELKQKAEFITGVSATTMDPIHQENIKDILYITPSIHYKGMDQITPRWIQGSFSGKKKDDLLELNPELIGYLQDFSSRQTVYPLLSLLSIGTVMEPYQRLQVWMSLSFPDLPTLLYNGEGIRVYYQGICEAALFKVETEDQILIKVMITEREKQESEGKKMTRLPSIRQVIQALKDKGITKMICMAGHLAGRGISFTSMDHLYHLSEQYFIPSDTCDDPELIQKIRLCGNYVDDIPLTLYTTESVWKDLQKANQLLDHVMEQTSQRLPESDSMSILPQLTISKDTCTKRKHRKNGKVAFTISKETEWDQNDELDWIEHNFERWSKPENPTKISSFMKDLDPHKCYSKSEMKDCLLAKGLGHNLSNLLGRRSSKSNRYGKILEEYQGGYRLYHPLVERFKRHFNY